MYDICICIYIYMRKCYAASPGFLNTMLPGTGEGNEFGQELFAKVLSLQLSLSFEPGEAGRLRSLQGCKREG